MMCWENPGQAAGHCLTKPVRSRGSAIPTDTTTSAQNTETVRNLEEHLVLCKAQRKSSLIDPRGSEKAQGRL